MFSVAQFLIFQSLWISRRTVYRSCTFLRHISFGRKVLIIAPSGGNRSSWAFGCAPLRPSPPGRPIFIGHQPGFRSKLRSTAVFIVTVKFDESAVAGRSARSPPNPRETSAAPPSMKSHLFDHWLSRNGALNASALSFPRSYFASVCWMGSSVSEDSLKRPREFPQEKPSSLSLYIFFYFFFYFFFSHAFWLPFGYPWRPLATLGYPLGYPISVS